MPPLPTYTPPTFIPPPATGSSTPTLNVASPPHPHFTENVDVDMNEKFQNITFEDFLNDYANGVSNFINVLNNDTKLIECIDIIDSGASLHGTPYLFRLFNTKQTEPITVQMANKSVISLSMVGEMRVRIPNPERGVNNFSEIIISNVYYHMQLNFTLISQARLCNQGYKFMYEGNKCIIWYPNRTKCGEITSINNMYMIECIYEQFNSIQTISLYELHKKLGHIGYDQIKHIIT